MVIDPSITHPEVESFKKIVEECPYPCTYHLPIMSDMDSISKSLSSSCGIIILGSAASVHDQSDWQSELASMLFKAIESEIPILGICFGHQAIAQALGGQVIKSSKGWGIGIKEITIKKHNSILGNFKKLNLIFFHQDQVIKLPQKAELIAGNSFCNISSFSILPGSIDERSDLVRRPKSMALSNSKLTKAIKNQNLGIEIQIGSILKD